MANKSNTQINISKLENDKTALRDKRPQRVLLVEDDPGNVMVASLILESIAVEFDIAMNGHEAIEKASSGTYGLIIMDVRLPDISGEEATKIIRDNEKEKGISAVRILCVTANAFVGDSENYLAAGMDDYLSKPYRQEEFESKILNLLNVMPANS